MTFQERKIQNPKIEEPANPYANLNRQPSDALMAKARNVSKKR